MEGKLKIGNILILALGFFVIYLWFHPKAAKPVVNPTPQETKTFLTIEKLNLKAPVVEAQSSEEPSIQENLQSGVVHLKGTASFGQIGNAYIVGHSSDYPQAAGNYKRVFERLPELQIGNQLIIDSGEVKYNYQVIETKVVQPNDLSVLSQETAGRRLLTLQTSYPIGTARQRFLVICELK
jgi:sortase A